jgi:hypothetical protein
MRITVELPEDIAEGLGAKWPDLSRAALESLAVDGYRSGVLTASQLRRLLGFASVTETDEFLKLHQVYDYTPADLTHDRKSLRQLRGE